MGFDYFSIRGIYIDPEKNLWLEMTFSYYSSKQQQHASEVLRSLVLQKVMNGLIIASSIVFLITILPIPPYLYILAFIAEIISIIGYFFAKSEPTIETLYYVFVTSSAVLLGFTVSSLLAVQGGTTVVFTATSTTAVVVGGIYYYTSTYRPNVSNMYKYLLPATLALFAVLIVGIFVAYSNTLNLIISIGGAILFSVYLYFDLGRLMNNQIGSPARMSWMIYWDILLIFKFILRLLIYSQKNR